MLPTRMLVVTVAMMVSVGSVLSAQDQQRGRGFGGGRLTVAGIVNIPDVQAELKLTDDQKAKLKDLPQFDRRASADLSREEQQKKREEVAAAAKKVIDETLNDEQKKRADQLVLQGNGAAGLNNAEVAKKVGLSEDQSKQIKEIAEARPERVEGQQFDFAKWREERDTKIVAVLNDEQKKKYEELKGPAFDVAKLRQGGRRQGGNNN